MKVPTLAGPRTRTPDNTQQYSRASVDASAFGAGLGQAIAGLGAAIKARDDKTNRFTALTNLSDFETEASQRLEEEKRGARPDGQGFAQGVEQSYDKFAAEFLEKRVPPDLREEFSVRIAQSKQGIIGNALDFQYKAGDEFFRQGISKVYEQGRNSLDPRLGGDPSKLAAWKAKVDEQIDASDLLPTEKEALRQKMTQGLEGVGYRAAVSAEATSFGANTSAANLIKKFEGNVLTAYPDKRASTGEFAGYRVGYGSDQITNPDGTHRAVRKGDKITQAQADADLARRIPIFQKEAAAQVGTNVWNALPGNVQAALTSVAWNYGNLPSSVVKAVQAGDVEGIATAVGNLRDNKDRRQQEAAVIRGQATPGSSVDDNPAFANVPYEDRIALREDAVRDVVAAQNAAAKQQKEMYESQVNSILTSIHDGTSGQSEIDAFRDSHPGMKYEDITKMDSALKQYNEGLGLARTGFEKMQAGLTFDPTDTDDKKRANAMVGKEGLASLDAGDQNYVTNSLAPMVTSIGMIPSDVSGMLTGMIRSNNQSKAMFALDVLSQLQDADPRAFNTGVSTDTANDVALYRMNRRSMSAEDLMKQINPGVTAEERNARASLSKEAKDILGATDHGIKAVSTMVQGFVKSFNSWNPFSAATSAGNIPWAAQGLAADYQTAFTNNYARVGDVNKAAELTEAQLKRDWSVTQIGVPTLMKHPPESVYKPYKTLEDPEGSYSYITDEIRQQYKLFGGEDIQILGDDTTDAEVQAFKQGTLDRPPSYRIASYKDGVWKEQPGRMWFKVPDEVRAMDDSRTELRQRAAVITRRLMELGGNIKAAQMGNVQVDPDEQTELDSLRQEYFDIRSKLRSTNPEKAKKADAEDAAKAGDFIGGLVNAPN